MSCPYCGHYNGGHGYICPENSPNRDSAIAAWNDGYSDGRTGKPMQAEFNLVYDLGYSRGKDAAEEAENSVPWSG